MSRFTIPFGVLLFVFYAGISAAAEPCPTCGGEPRFPEAAAFLAAHGYPAGQFTVLMSWSEISRDGTEKYVTGYRVRPTSGGEPFDVYSDGSASLLSPAQLAALGIPKKNWSLPPIERKAELPSAVTKALPPKPTPVGPAKSIQPSAGIVAPNVDVAAALQEDEDRKISEGKGVERVGLLVQLDHAITVHGSTASDGFWQSLPDGSWLWSAVVYSPDALGIRVHFSEISLPAGAQVTLYNSENPAEAYGPYTKPAPTKPDLWTATCFSEGVAVECVVPASVDRSSVALTIDSITHNYVQLGDVAWTKAAGSCNLDVSCYPAWATTSTAIGGLGFVSNSGSLFCTGTLIVDSDPFTNIPYVLTANHCVGSSGTAASVEVYWLYQTPSCNGTPPDILTVPRTTGGAALLATNTAASGTDFCLLRLNNPAAGGVAYAGWSTTATPLTTLTAGVHHPSGDYKRISFGSVTDVSEASRPTHPADRFYQSSWSAGVTEPGSSGSPLFIESNQRIIGQLWGGPSSCSPSSTKLDYYGRFDISYPVIQSFLGTGIILADLDAGTYSIAEAGTQVIINVELSQAPGTGNSVQITCATQNGTALAGVDYTNTSTVLNFGPTDVSKTFTVPILDNHRHQTDRSFSVLLSNPVNCTLANTDNPATVTINDDDPDTDNDMLSDYEETHGTFGHITSPTNPDTDGDGVSDGIEVSLGTDPTNQNDFPSVSLFLVPQFFTEIRSR